MKHSVALLLIALGTAAGFAAPGLGQATSLAMLDQLDRGDWQMRIREEGGSMTHICLGDSRKLIQLRHPDTRCQSIVVDDGAAEVTVQYTCPGRGYGRTTVRRETNKLVQIDSQGIANGLPFAFAAEARRVGDCKS